MSAENEFGSDFITITDEDGQDYELEHLDTFEMDGEIYMAFLPADMDEDDPDYGFVILKTQQEDGEEFLVTPADDEEAQRAYEFFVTRILDDEDEE